jgi:plastocyanin
MRTLILVPLTLVLATATPAQQPARTVHVQLSSFKFRPQTLRLRAGEPIVLHLVNTGSGGHNFVAPRFFAAARVAPESSGRINRGGIEVPSRSAVDVRLIPARGTYRLRCTHTLHSTFGMRGSIVVN